MRGQPDNDRDYRHPRVRAERPSKRGTNRSPRNGASIAVSELNPAADWDLLPPVLEIIEAIDAFTRHYFQLSFISRNSFVTRLRHDYRSVSPFLLLSILSISAGMTPPLVERFGSGTAAAEAFMTHATELSVRKVYEHPNLEACQAFYLLGVAQQRSGWNNSSYVSVLLSSTIIDGRADVWQINIGISIRMAVLMGLHLEGTYTMGDPTPDSTTKAESARRTLVWYLFLRLCCRLDRTRLLDTAG